MRKMQEWIKSPMEKKRRLPCWVVNWNKTRSWHLTRFDLAKSWPILICDSAWNSLAWNLNFYLSPISDLLFQFPPFIKPVHTEEQRLGQAELWERGWSFTMFETMFFIHMLLGWICVKFKYDSMVFGLFMWHFVFLLFFVFD